MQYAAVYDLLAVLIFSAATAFCAAAWGRSGRREMQSAGFFCAALTVDAAHIMEQGVIVKNGDASLVDTINENGFGGIRAD